MKQFFRKYWISIIICVVFVSAFSFFVIQYHIEYTKMVSTTKKIIEQLENGSLENPYEEFSPTIPIKTDAISLFFSILADKFRFLIPMFPLFLILPSCYYLHQKLKTGFIRNEMTRKSYKQFLKEHLKICYKNILIVPICLLSSFFICFAVCGRIDIWNSYENVFEIMTDSLETQYIRMLPIFLILYLTNLILLAGYYTNITLLFVKKKLPYLVSCIASFLTVLGIGIFLELAVGYGLLEIFFGIDGMTATFNTYCFWSPGDSANSYIQFIIVLTLFIISSICVLKSYQNQEKVLIANEL